MLDPDSLPAPDPPATLDSLPEDVFAILWQHLRRLYEDDRQTALFDALGLFSLSKRLQALGRSVIQVLRLGMLYQTGQFQLPIMNMGEQVQLRRECALLANMGWARRWPNLRELRLSHLTWSGAARVIMLLPAWPELHTLDIQFEYTPNSIDLSLKSSFQRFVADLGSALKMGSAPKLRHLFLGSIDKDNYFAHTHSFGQNRARPPWERGEPDDQTESGDDSAILERLPPTAALWWMAERAEHVRVGRLHQWRYELEHGADVHGTFAGFTLLEWLHRRLAWQMHSRAGHRAVHALLLEYGADDTKFREYISDGNLRVQVRSRLDAEGFEGHTPGYVPDLEDEFESDEEEFLEERERRARDAEEMENTAQAGDAPDDDE